jgi:hypothetical protein
MTTRARLVAVVLVATAGALGFALYLSLDPDNYFFYTAEDRARWQFSFGHVLLVCGIMLAEAVIWGVALLSTRPKHLWVRSLIALLVLVPWGLYTIQFVMHTPVYVHFHHLWLWLVILSLAVTAVASGTMHAVSIARVRREAV